MSARKPPGRKKRAARRTGTTKKVARKSASKPVRQSNNRKSAPKRATPRPTVRKKTTKKPAPLKVVRGRFARPRLAKANASAPAFPQTKTSTSKQKLLFELVRARVGVHAAIQGLQPASAEEIARPGRWSVRRHILHLIVIDRAVLHSIEGALLGTVPAWARLTPAQQATFEQQEASPLLHLDWAEALRRLHASRDQLIEALKSVPDDPAVVWEPGHPFADLLTRVITGDREQAEVIKRWRTSRGSPSLV